jgi:hypothetical protein
MVYKRHFLTRLHALRECSHSFPIHKNSTTQLRLPYSQLGCPLPACSPPKHKQSRGLSHTYCLSLNFKLDYSTGTYLRSESSDQINSSMSGCSKSVQGSRVQVELDELRRRNSVKSQRDRLKDCTYRTPNALLVD